MSIGHIPGKCQSGCKPLCFRSTGDVQSLGIEAAQVKLCNQAELRMRGGACVKGVIDNDGYVWIEMLACTDRAETIKLRKHRRIYSRGTQTQTNNLFCAITKPQHPKFKHVVTGCTKPGAPMTKYHLIPSTLHLAFMSPFHWTVSMLWI